MKAALTFALSLTAMAVCHTAYAQSLLLRSDAVEMKRTSAMASVQRLALSARSQHDPQIAFSKPGERGCTFNIGDIAAAQAADNATQLGRPLQRKALGRTEYITLVDATPICVQR